MFSTEAVDAQVETLRRRVQETESQLRALKLQLQQAEASAHESRLGQNLEPAWQDEVMAALDHGDLHRNEHEQIRPQQQFALSGEEYKRYGRQLILPEIGLRGQQRLKNCAVLIVGVGGLGCPAATYLAGAGVGTLGLVDGDTVEVSNLHRQIAHSTHRVGKSKVDSAMEYLGGLNPLVKIISHRDHLTPQDALSIFRNYDVVLDCTDHPTSRYLISDACVLTGKPLVSASALRTEGQLIVLNNPPRAPGDIEGGPCYRCVFPKPPPVDSVVSCGEGGILGPVVGVMGVLQALEAIKLIVGGIESVTDSSASTTPSQSRPAPSLLLFSAYSTPPFRSVRIRSRRLACASCSATASITSESLTSGSMDYVAFCGVTNPVNVLDSSERITAGDFPELARQNPNMVLVDVRDATQFELCNLPGSINIPWADFAERVGNDEDELQQLKDKDVVVVCKLGNDSQLAVKMLKDLNGAGGRLRDIKGGFRAWRDDVDPTWPDY